MSLTKPALCQVWSLSNRKCTKKQDQNALVGSKSNKIANTESNNSRNFMFLNIQGILDKCDMLHILAIEHSIEVIGIAEHWLNHDNISLAGITNFKVASHFCRTNKKRGGSAILIKDNLIFESLPNITKLALEEIFEISACYIVSYKTAFICIYRNPSLGNKSKFKEMFDILLNSLFSMNVNVVIMADFNINFNCNDSVNL